MNKNKLCILLIIAVFIVTLSGCSNKDNVVSTEYFGDYENDDVYQKIVNIENCIDPEKLVLILEDIYGEKITYLSLKYDENTKAFKSPYEDFKFNVLSVYSTTKNKGTVSSDAYAFFMEYNESPIFIMDASGSYFVGNYEIVTIRENEYSHEVDAWVLTDLYLCLHKHTECDGDEMRRKAYSNIVKSMIGYVNFETRLSNRTNISEFEDIPNSVDNEPNEPEENTSGYHEEYVETYYISALEGAVITWQDSKTGEYEFVGKCVSCGRSESSTHSAQSTSGTSNYGFVCTNSKCPLAGKSQQIRIKAETKGEWIKTHN